jgi:predicted transcriptional regulator
MIPQTSKQTLRKGTFYKDPKRQSLRLTNKQKIEIIEFYTHQKSNGIKDICIYFNISIDRANTLINDYLKNGSLVLESKINNEIE